jgi:hypothetical protein
MTIKRFAHDYFMRVSFVDIYGRNIGYDYDFILAEIRATFPGARTSRRWLQDMAYVLNRSAKLPVRRRSRRALSEDFAMALLLRPIRYVSICNAVRNKFPDHVQTLKSLRSLEGRLKNRGFVVPERT